MKKLPFLLFTLLSFFFIPFFAGAATIKGHVKDAKNNENLIGATVYLKENNQVNDVAGLDGSFNLKNVAPGSYTLVVQFFSYVTEERSVTVANATDEIVQDFSLSPDSMMLKQVEVVGSYNPGSDNYARNEEKNSPVIMNVMSAKTIQLLPDITIGDVMQRVSGVTIERSVTGGGKYAIIRGMEKRYVLTMVNGVEIPSPDPKNRYVPLDIFPAEIVERLEIYKTLIPSLPGTGTAGIINLVLKDAPDRFTLDANVATGENIALYSNPYYKFNSSVISSQSPAQQMGESAFTSAVAPVNGVVPASGVALFPTADYTYTNSRPLANVFSGFTIGDRFLHDKLGAIFSVDYQNTYSTTSGFFMLQDQPGWGTSINNPNFPQFSDIESRFYSTQNEREAAHLKLDYDLNPKHKISFYTAYFGFNQYRSDIINDTANIGRGPGIGQVNYEDETKVTEQHIYNSTLKGTDSLCRNLSFDWTGSYSRAWQNTPDWGDMQTYSGVKKNYQNLNDSILPDYWSSIARRWFANTDQDFAGYVNLTYKMKIFGQDVEWKVGAMNRDKQRNQTYESDKFSFATNELVAGTTITDPSTFNPIPGLSSAVFSGINNTNSALDPNNYTLQEDVNAYYAQGKINLGSKVQVLGGLRVENTSDSYQSNLSVYDEWKYGTITYSDYLPSIEITYALNPKMNLKAGYYASTSRPNFNEIVPYSITGDYYNEAGNPELKRTQADNLDLRYEFFPAPSEEILAGVFYKVLTDPIEYTLASGTITPENDSTSKATNYGFELQVMKYIKHFGISANYTYTKSQITVSEQEFYKYYPNASYTTPRDTSNMVNETRPLQGQANNIANLSLLYKDNKIGLDMQLSGVYTGMLISQASPYYELDNWQMPMVKLDFSFQKRLSKKYKISLFGKVMNILNTPYIIEITPPSSYINNPVTNPGTWLPGQSTNNGSLSHIVVEKETYGQSFVIGVRYKF